MKKIIFFLFFPIFLSAQTYHIYTGTNTNYSNIIYTTTDVAVFSGPNTNYSNQIFTISNNKVYSGHTTNYVDLKYIIEPPYIMDKSGNIYLYTIDGNKIYDGKGTNYVNCVFTYDNYHVYDGNSTNYSNILYTVNGDISIYTIAWLLGSETVTGINERNLDKNIDVKYYDMMGKLMTHPSGLCIKKPKLTSGKLIFIK